MLRWDGLAMGSTWKCTLVVVGLLGAACAPSQQVISSDDQRNRPQHERSEDETTRLTDGYPPLISGAFGTSKTSAYKQARHDSINSRPYSDNSGVLIDNSNTFSVPPAPQEIARLARLVIKGKVVGLGLPHFNSSDGSFWDPALHEEPGKVELLAAFSWM